MESTCHVVRMTVDMFTYKPWLAEHHDSKNLADHP
jgi:hypothetical protein